MFYFCLNMTANTTLIIWQAHEKMGLSPGNHTLKYAAKCQKRRLEKEQSQHKLSTKRRRIILKHERATQQGAMEAIEGVSYQSGEKLSFANLL